MEDTDNQYRRVSLVILFGVMIPISFFIADPGRARAAAVCAAVFAYTIWSRWRLRYKVWFWIVLVLLAAGHLPLILLVRWSDGWISPQGLLGMALIDLAYVCGPIWRIEEATSRGSKIS